MDTLLELLNRNPDIIEEYKEMNYKNEDPNIIREIEQNKLELDLFHEGKKIVKNKKEQGDLLENYIISLVKTVKIFEFLHNKRTSGNEIDILLKLNDKGKKLRALKIIPHWVQDYIVIECKNYSEKVGITYINKFHSLMSMTGVNFGIFATYKGIKGKEKLGWQDAYGLIKKINLVHHTSSFKPLMIDLDFNGYENFQEEYNFIMWLDKLHSKIAFDLKSEDEFFKVESHENQNDILNIIYKDKNEIF